MSPNYLKCGRLNEIRIYYKIWWYWWWYRYAAYLKKDASKIGADVVASAK